jgi:hypothetical protein
MLRLRPKPGTPPLGVHLCAGLTLTHYKNFAACPTLPHVRDLHRQRWPLQTEHGIHILLSEHADGQITLGDSHAYGRSGPVYQEEAIDEAILAAMDAFLPREGYEIVQRWQGTYLTHSDLPFWQEEIEAGVWALSLFGTGMTLSFGVTARLTQRIVEHLE